VLEHHADLAPRGAQLAVGQLRHVAPGHQHLAAAGPVEQVDHPHQRTFAGTAAPDDAEHLARRDVQVDAAQGLDGAAGALVDLGDSPKVDHGEKCTKRKSAAPQAACGHAAWRGKNGGTAPDADRALRSARY